jgi:hypothetical protein
VSKRALIAVLLCALALTGACSKKSAKRDHGAITKAGLVSVFDLRPGDCLLPDKKVSGEIDKINAVPCKDPHTQEVFAVPDYPDKGGVYPGEDAIKKFADAACLEAFGKYTGTDYLDSNLFFSYLHPSVDSWNSGDDRQVVCVIVATGKEMTGTVKGTTTTTRKGTAATSSTSTTIKKTTTTVATTATSKP